MIMQARYPELNLSGIKMYLEGGDQRHLGGFTFAVINNDLKDACALADDENLELIPVYVHWLFNNAPSGAWGYSGASREWKETCAERRARHEKANA